MEPIGVEQLKPLADIFEADTMTWSWYAYPFFPQGVLDKEMQAFFLNLNGNGYGRQLPFSFEPMFKGIFNKWDEKQWCYLFAFRLPTNFH